MIKDLNAKAQTVKLIEGHIRVNLCDLYWELVSLIWTQTSDQGITEYIKAKTFCAAENYHQEREKLLHRMVENICKSCIPEDTYIQNIKRTITTKWFFKKINNPLQKQNRIWVFPEKIHKGQINTWKYAQRN